MKSLMIGLKINYARKMLMPGGQPNVVSDITVTKII